MARKYSSEYKSYQPYVVEDARKVANAVLTSLQNGGSTVGVTDHGALTGLSDDDHPQYLTPVRGDARYIASTRTLTAGAGLTGGGDLSADRTFAVGAGLGITVNADDVALASSVAGNGLTYTTGVLAVGAGAGLTVNADDVALTTPGTLTVTSTNTATGSHTHAVTSSSSPGQATSLLKTDTNGALTLYNGFFTQGAQSAATFASGWAGSGWRADYGITTASRASIETDDLTVRGRMRVYELLIQQIRATNGSLVVSSSSKVVTTTNSTNPLWTVNGSQLTFNGSNATLTFTYCVIATAAAGDTSRELYHGFLVGDLVRAQQVQWNGSTFAGVMQSNMEVTGVSSLYNYTAAVVSGDAPAVGYDFVRLGSASNTARQGVVYLTSDDSAAPFIDIVDGVNSFTLWNSAGAIKARLGKLTGISDTDFGGALSGYGLYSTNVYLKGNIYATSGIFNGTVYASAGSFTGTVYASAGSFTGAVTATSGSFTGSLTSTSGTIGGWTLGATSLTAGSGANTVGLDSGGTNPALYAGSATPASAPFQVTKTGDLTATSATITGSIGATGGGVISGNWYVGYDVSYAGSMYFGSGGKARVGTNGMSLVMESLGSSPTIPTSSSSLRWFPDISESYTHTNAKNYSGIIGYKHTGITTIDNIWTAYVGSTDYATYAARVMIQAGHMDGSSVYTDARLEVVREAGSGLRYVGIYGDRLEVNGAIGAAIMTAPGASWASGSLIYTDTADGDLKVRFANGTVKVLATN